MSVKNAFLAMGLFYSLFHVGIVLATPQKITTVPKAEDCTKASFKTSTLVFEEETYIHELKCKDGLALERVRIFKKNGVVGSHLVYTQGKPSYEYTYNSGGELTEMSEFELLSEGQVIIARYEIKDQKPVKLKEKVEVLNYDVESYQIQRDSYTARRWFYSSKKTDELEFIATYEKQTNRIIRKDYLDQDGKLSSYITFQYEDFTDKPTGFKEWNASGEQINSYEKYEKFDPKASLESLNITPTERERRLNHQLKSNRFLMGAIDSGFDYNHPELVWKWWNNPTDPVDGIDNDGNGWTDDQFGWDREGQIHLPSETTSSFAHTGLKRPDSHGTHVTHIATRHLENIALVGFSGDYTQVAFINKISDFIRRHNVKVINMSFGLPSDIKDSLNLRAANRAYTQMALDNPGTLFVVSAGNAGHNIDLFENKQFPASINLPNVMKVGSLDTDKIERNKMSHYKISSWSNWGPESVDILAPGKDIRAARLGGGYVVHSGTSMAAPFMTREVARLWMKFPELTAEQVKQIFIKTAYPMAPKPEIKSGGFVDFEKAVSRASTMQNTLRSVVCPKKSSGAAITCCLSDKLCSEAMESTTQQMKERSQLIHENFFNGVFKYAYVPNCHWNAASYLLGKTLPLQPLEEWKLSNLISDNGSIEISIEDVQAGDLILYYFVGKERHESTSPGGAWTWSDYTSLEHSAVALSNDVVFQKENIGTHVFSIASIEQTREAYEKSFLKGKAGRYRGKIIAKAFRPRR